MKSSSISNVNTPIPPPPNKHQSRKFIYAIGLSTISTLALFTNKSSMKDWVDVNKFLFTSYIAGNVIQKVENKFT